MLGDQLCCGKGIIVLDLKNVIINFRVQCLRHKACANALDFVRAGLSAGGIVVMGSEGNGISSGTARCVTRRLFIPPYPGAAPTSESLNVAMATAVVAAEFRRRIR